MKVTFKEKQDVSKEYITTAFCCLNPKDNGGESITLEVDVFDNGDDDNFIFYNTYLNFQCYGTHSTRVSFGNVNINNLKNAFDEIKDKMVGILMKKVKKTPADVMCKLPKAIMRFKKEKG